MKKLFPFLFIALLAGSPTWSEDGIDGAITIYQNDPDSSYEHLLFADTSTFVAGIPASGFLLTFSVDIDLKAADSSGCEFTVHIITLGPRANTHSRSFRVEYGLPARIGDIEGKGTSRFTFEFTPLRMAQIDTATCSFSHRRAGTFTKDPSAHLDINYLPNSLGDFYWGAVRGIMEEHYRRIQTLYNFTLPGKYDVYLCPCYLPSVIWDKRFGTAVDPTRATAHAVFTKALNTADPFLLAHTAVLRNYGYAPPFLSEGLANYISFALFDMKEIVADGEATPLVELLDTYRYYTADPYLADRIAATFVMYLVNEFGWTEFKKLYVAADDLNLKEKIEEQYNRSIDELEQGWRTYVDTSVIDPEGLVFYAELAEAMFNYKLMLRYSRTAVELSKTHQDSVRHLSLLKRACLFNGDYYGATEAQQALVQLESSSASYWMTLGTYRMMNGLYDEAYDDISTAFGLDSTSHSIRFNLAMNYLHRGDEETAAGHLTQIVNQPSKGGPHAGAMVMLADILRRSADEKDRGLATQYYAQAIRGLEMSLQSGTPSPSVHLWLGMSYLGMDRYSEARGYLEGALFLETRPFYLGMMHLWLGKLADVTNERQAAIDHYSEVLALPSADYHQREAQTYYQTPYTQ